MHPLRAAILAALLLTAACAPRPGAQMLAPDPDPGGVAPSGAPSAVPLPLPTYPYDPGFWV